MNDKKTTAKDHLRALIVQAAVGDFILICLEEDMSMFGGFIEFLENTKIIFVFMGIFIEITAQQNDIVCSSPVAGDMHLYPIERIDLEKMDIEESEYTDIQQPYDDSKLYL